MKTLTLLALLTLTSCTGSAETLQKVECSSGFSTGWVKLVHLNLGHAVTWEVKDTKFQYVMLRGETCKKTLKKVTTEEETT
jgi:hypothetical protein